MVSRWMMIGLICAYVLILTASLFEHNYKRSVYFFGAIILTVALLM